MLCDTEDTGWGAGGGGALVGGLTYIGVALYTPVTTLRQLDYIIVSSLAIPLGACHLGSAGVWYANAPYVMALYTTFVYTSLAYAKVQPHVDATILVSAYICISIFAFIFLRWLLHLSFQSS